MDLPIRSMNPLNNRLRTSKASQTFGPSMRNRKIEPIPVHGFHPLQRLCVIIACVLGMIGFFVLYAELVIAAQHLIKHFGRWVYDGACLAMAGLSLIVLLLLALYKPNPFRVEILRAFLVAGFTVWLVMWPLSLIITFAPVDPPTRPMVIPRAAPL